MNRPVRHAVLRDRRAWPDCALSGLVADADGVLRLRRIPAPTGVISVPGPYRVTTSGLAVSADGIVAYADGSEGCLVVEDTRCAATMRLPGRGRGIFTEPRGVAIGSEHIWVADAGAGRVLGIRRSDLQVALVLGGLDSPVAVAEDEHGRVVVADVGARAVRRFTGGGFEVDAEFDSAAAAAMTAHLPQPIQLVSLAIEAHMVWVSDASSGQLIVLDDTGGWQGQVSLGTGRSSGALAGTEGLLVVADTTTGALVLVDTSTQEVLGDIPRVTSPAAAMAWTHEGGLLLKAGAAPDLLSIDPTNSALSQGTVLAGPLDAGEGDAWFRAFVDCQVPAGASATLAVAQSPTPAPPGTEVDWRECASTDVRLQNLGAGPERRFLHLRVTLRSSPTGESAALRQVAAHTEPDNPEQFLPRTYRRADEPHQFLARLLGHAAAGLDVLERPLDDLPALLSAQGIAADGLPWLASWMALDLPRSLSSQEWRDLVPHALDLHERRGTVASLRHLVHQHTGADIAIREDYRDRHLWLLDADRGSRLGFDTGLPAVVPPGLVLSDEEGVDEDAPTCEHVIGAVTVGEVAPLPFVDWSTPLYRDAAHRFHVSVSRATACVPGLLDAVVEVLERERPAHVQFCVDVVPDELTVGAQATVGVDAVVASGPAPTELDSALLSASWRLGGSDEPPTTPDLVVGLSMVPTPRTDGG